MALFMLMGNMAPQHGKAAKPYEGTTVMDPWRNSHFTSEQFRSAFPGAGEYLDSIKESFGQTVPGVLIPGGSEYQLRIAEMVSRALQKSMTPKEALDQAVEEWDKITKRRGLKKQQELWRQQMAAMKETGGHLRSRVGREVAHSTQGGGEFLLRLLLIPLAIGCTSSLKLWACC